MKKTKGLFGLWLALVVSVAMLAAPTLATGVDESAGEADFEPWLLTGGSAYFSGDTSGETGSVLEPESPAIYYYPINASASGGGSISPEGYTSVVMGGSQTYTIAPDEGMYIKDVIVDGESIGAVESYTFENVWESHTIEVVFSKWVSTYEDCQRDDDCLAGEYSDVDPLKWYHHGLHFCVENGLLSGSNGELMPNDEATRAMAIVVLWRASGCPQVEGDASFADVKEGSWYADAARWAKAEGLVFGYGNGKYFGPNDPVTREQLMTILWRYAQWQGHDVSEGEDTNILSYDDAFDVSEYAIPAIQWAAATGMLQGVDTPEGGKIIDPQGESTRSQLATFVMRHLEGALQ